MAEIEVKVVETTDKSITVESKSKMRMSFDIEAKYIPHDLKIGDEIILEVPDEHTDIYNLKPN